MQAGGIQERHAAQIQHDMLRPRRRGVLELFADLPDGAHIELSERADANHVALDRHHDPKWREGLAPGRPPAIQQVGHEMLFPVRPTPGTTRCALLPETPWKAGSLCCKCQVR